MSTPDNDPEIAMYLRSDVFRVRADALRARALADVAAGRAPPTFEEIASELRLPLDVIEGGLQHALAKRLLRDAPVRGEPN